jgi:hypothetical protein
MVVNPPTLAEPCTRTSIHTASSLHSQTLANNALSTRTCSYSELSSFSPVQLQFIMPQVMLQLLPIPKGGRGCRVKMKINKMSNSQLIFSMTKKGGQLCTIKRRRSCKQKLIKAGLFAQISSRVKNLHQCLFPYQHFHNYSANTRYCL